MKIGILGNRNSKVKAAFSYKCGGKSTFVLSDHARLWQKSRAPVHESLVFAHTIYEPPPPNYMEIEHYAGPRHLTFC